MSIKFNMEAASRFVARGMRRAKRRQESASGPGSSMKATEKTRESIKSIIQRYKIESILDLGCGDWNWMPDVMFPNKGEYYIKKYVGAESNQELVNTLQDLYESDTIHFEVADIFNVVIGSFDLVICRDVLFHADMNLALKLLHNVAQSDSKYFLSTTFPSVPKNVGIHRNGKERSWGFYPINLDIAPFNLSSAAIEQFGEGFGHRKHPRCMALYDIKQMRKVI